MATDCCVKTQEAHQFLRDERSTSNFLTNLYDASFPQNPVMACQGGGNIAEKKILAGEDQRTGWHHANSTNDKTYLFFSTRDKEVLHVLYPFPFSGLTYQLGGLYSCVV